MPFGHPRFGIGKMCLAVAGCMFFIQLATAQLPADRPQRRVALHYAGSVKEVPANSRVRVWIPLAQSNVHQDVKVTGYQLPETAQEKRTKDNVYANEILYFEVLSTSGEIDFQVDFDVIRRAARIGDRAELLSDDQRQAFLRASRLVPLTGTPAMLLPRSADSKDGFTTGRQLYDFVYQFMTYDKSKPGYGKGDVLWACDSRTGNCTDFHSLFISLARQRDMPAFFEIGFPLPDEKAAAIPGYHCWAWFRADPRGWVPVDISEADKHPNLKNFFFGNLDAHRVAMSVGRDIQLEPPPASKEPLNYFVFPYVEVDGQVWPNEKMKTSVSYAEIAQDAQDAQDANDEDIDSN